LCKREMLDDIIANQRKLHPVSSLDCDQFGFVCRRFIEQSKKHTPDGPCSRKTVRTIPETGASCRTGTWS